MVTTFGAPAFSQMGLGLLEPLGVDVDEGEAHAALGSLFSEGAADAGGGAR